MTAIDIRIKECRPMVKSIAYEVAWSNNKLSHMDDLIQEGFFGVFKAVEKYNFTGEEKFKPYARKYIYSAMREYIFSIAGLSRTHYHGRLMRNFLKLKNNHPNLNDFEVLSLADFTDEQKRNIAKILNFKVSSDEYVDILYTNEDEKTFHDKRLVFMQDLLLKLTEKQRLIVDLFLQNKTHTDIAAELEISKSTIQSVLNEIKPKLRKEWMHFLFTHVYSSEFYSDYKHRFHYEQWKPVITFEDSYAISNYGRLLKINKLEIKKPKLKESGRYIFYFKSKGKEKTLEVNSLIGLHFSIDELPKFYENENSEDIVTD